MSNNSGRGLEGFFTGKGFYIVLFLCAAVIGVSAWMLAAGNRAMVEEEQSLENRRVETVIIPPPEEDVRPAIKSGEPEPEITIEDEEKAPAEAPEALSEDGSTSQVWRQGDVLEVAAPAYMWPVSGQLERVHDAKKLSYDVTMQDWRTHEGIDILAPLGTSVTAAHAGTVASVEDDDLYGTTVIIDRGDGIRSVYSNLEEHTAVTAGDYVEAGSVIGAVGSTAICESGQCSHLHFAMEVNGESADPLDYLPA